jgi:DsbC/DsbD-like thiol-disulfide interchange protein
MRRFWVGLVAIASIPLVLPLQLGATDKSKLSESKVKITADASKVGPDGKQNVTLTLTIEKGWHIYANPVNFEDLAGAQTVVKVSAKGKVSNVAVNYPPGKMYAKEKYDVYEGTIKIPVSLKRAAGDTSPLEVSVFVQACDHNVCLKESTISLTVK